MNSHALGLRALVALSLAAIAAPAQAYLGGFEPADGYQVQSGFIGGDVSYYNAGAHGPNAGGGALVHAAPNAGLWKIDSTSQPGGYFATQVLRAGFTLGAPPYMNPPNPPVDTVESYIVGNHSMGRTGTCLAIRNEPVGVGPMIYVITPNGRVLETHPVTATHHPTNCCFGGRDMTTFFLCTRGQLFKAQTDRVGWAIYP